MKSNCYLNEDSTRYRAECDCGWNGRWFINGNDAVTAQDRHEDLIYQNKLPVKFRRWNHRIRIVDNDNNDY